MPMKVGPKFTYDVNKFDEIIASIEKAMGSLGQVADLNHIPRATFYEWLSIGDADRNAGISSPLAQLAGGMREAQAKVVIQMCHTAMTDDKKSKFIMWMLSRICREDFGVEGMEIKELRDLFKIILPLIGKDANSEQRQAEQA